MSDEFEPTHPQGAFITFNANAQSGVGLADHQDPKAIVQVELAGKWNHSDPAVLTTLFTADLAEELGTILRQAAKAARRDLDKYKSAN